MLTNRACYCANSSLHVIKATLQNVSMYEIIIRNTTNKVKQLEEAEAVEKSIVGAKESAAASKEIKHNESDSKSSSDEETDDLEDEAAVVNKALDLSPGMKEKCIALYHDCIQKLNKSMNHNITATMQVYEGEMSTTEDNRSAHWKAHSN